MTADQNLVTQQVRAVAETIVAVFANTADLAALANYDREVMEGLMEAAELASSALLADDYDVFKYAVTLLAITPNLFPTDHKWRFADIAGDVVWTINRQKLEESEDNPFSVAVNNLLDDLFPTENS